MRQFARLLRWEIRCGTVKIWPAAAIFSVLYAAYWVIMLLTGTAAGAEDRIAVLYIGAQFFAFCVPAAAYGHINSPSDGIGYAILPVGNPVKFASMMTVSVIIIPFCFYTWLYAMDSALAFAGEGNGFSGMIWAADNAFCGFWSDFGKICLYQSVFILGNIIFRKHKVTFTILAMLLLHGLCIGVLHIDEIKGIIPVLLYSYVLPVLIWALSYQCLKRVQYR
ncbi:MAG TPA: hypothetical protein IAC04_07470 [Candidatus Coprenecus stercoravium]|uniref:Uncharacterized protein n=1 Tax=Candidatus Coprenecus stercoravium TaxID=2840735 RepID=A0A9D2K9A6_9BACT|nr:hypothetical protein [Candidatus Coprenecus stercoravium]